MTSGGGDKKIGEAIKSIPEMKEKVQQAFDSVQSYSSSLATFALQWKDLEDHFIAIHKAIHKRLNSLQRRATGNDDEEEEAEEEDSSSSNRSPSPSPRAAELRSLCANMDAKGLRSYISDNQNDSLSIRDEIAPAIRCAPDPALLVLNAMEGFYPKTTTTCRKGEKEDRRTCIDLLEKLHLISPTITPSVREKAKKVALRWNSNIPTTGDFALEALSFLHLIAAYNLVSDFPLDRVMDLFISVSRRKQAVHLIKSLGFTNKLPDVIQRLNSKGRQIDAVKFVYALDAVDKFPPVPLLKDYVNVSMKAGQEVLKKGNNSLQAQNEANDKERAALKAVLKAVEDYKLEAEYPREDLVRRIAKIERKSADKKRSAAASNSKPPQHQQQQANKRPRPSSLAAVPAANTYSPLGLGGPHVGMGGPYNLVATGSGSVYNNHGGPNIYDSALGGHGETYHCPPPSYGPAPSTTGSLYDLSGSATRHGATSHSSPPRSYYSLEEGHAYERPVSYNGGYALPPPSYGSSHVYHP